MSKTFDLQSSLPRLPVLELDATVSKYLKTIEPYCANEQEYNRHKALVLDFSATVGPKLQALLLQRYIFSTRNLRFAGTNKKFTRGWRDGGMTMPISPTEILFSLMCHMV